jgi:hypothetical protein
MRSPKATPRARRCLRLALPLLGTFSHKVVSPFSGDLYRYGIAHVAKFIARCHMKHARFPVQMRGFGQMSIVANVFVLLVIP